MGDTVTFASRDYCLMLLLLAIWRIHRAAKKLKARQNPQVNGKSLMPVKAWIRVENRPADKIF